MNMNENSELDEKPVEDLTDIELIAELETIPATPQRRHLLLNEKNNRESILDN